jgi:tetratricopeptide (TPR) repeat protein
MSQSPAPITLPLFFVDIDDMEKFQTGWTLLLQGERRARRKKEYETALRQRKHYNIQPNARYSLKEYTEIFNKKLDLFDLSLEVGETSVAAEMANEAMAMTEVNPRDDAQVRLAKLAQRVEALWRIAPDFGGPELLKEAYSSAELLVSLCATVTPAMLPSVLQLEARKYLTLAESMLDRPANLQMARELLERAQEVAGLSPSGAEDLARTYCCLGDYAKAQPLLEPLKAKSPDLYRLWVLASHRDPAGFRGRFGPFAAAIYAECKAISLAEAWQEIEGMSFRRIVGNVYEASGMLIGDVVVYERHSLPGENRWADVALHEAMHLSVRKGQAYKSEGVWLTAKRDVPTAALRTYHQYLQRAREKGISPPRSLGFLSDHGRTAMGQRAHGIGDHIANMLDYFAVLKEESNAAYVCAAILAGVLDVLLQGDDQLIENYISHLVVVDHVTALDKARRRVPLQL